MNTLLNTLLKWMNGSIINILLQSAGDFHQEAHPKAATVVDFIIFEPDG